MTNARSLSAHNEFDVDDIVEYVHKKIGNFYPTNKISWDKNDQAIDRLNNKLGKQEKLEKIITTPLKDLVKCVEDDDIESL